MQLNKYRSHSIVNSALSAFQKNYRLTAEPYIWQNSLQIAYFKHGFIKVNFQHVICQDFFLPLVAPNYVKMNEFVLLLKIEARSCLLE